MTRRAFTDLKFFKEYANQLSVGNTIAFNFGENANLYSELIGAYMHFGKLGYARVGFGALVSASDDSTANTAEQFFDGGGNASFYVALPLYYRLSAVRTDSTVAAAGSRFVSRQLDLYLVTSVGADLPTLNAAVTDRAGVLQFGPQVSLRQNATDDAISIFVQAGGGVAIGTREFYSNAEIENDTERPFLFGQASFGIDLNKLIRVGATIGTSSLDELSRPLSLSVQILPQRL